MTTWLEVSLTVNGELAEAVADVLARFAPSGVVVESGVAYRHDEDEGTPSGAVCVRAYFPIDDKIEKTRRKLEESLYYLGMIQPLPAPIFRPIADQSWMEAWKEHYLPIPIGKRLIIVPAWLGSPDEKRIPIKIDPGMAFGTGTHPTTQLCLELLESLFDAQSSIVNCQSSIIDVGCGSGILSIAAIKLGARQALCVDLDKAAIQATRENAEANGATESLLLGVGSVKEIRAGKFAFRQAPLVLANILAPVILRLFADGLADLVAPGGALILSGILQEQTESVVSAAQAHGMKLVEKKQMEDWVALRLER